MIQTSTYVRTFSMRLTMNMLDEFVKKAKNEWHKNIKFEVSINGTLLSPHVVDWLIANDVTLFLSLDGTGRVQNRQRKTSSGLGSFKQIIDALHYKGYMKKAIKMI